jgi:D-alanyl-D-alanine carboxypeptidase
LQLPVKSIGPDGRMVWNPASEWTGGGYVSNSADLAHWVRMEFSGRAASYDYLDTLVDGAPEAVRKGGSHYGLGVTIASSPFGRMLGHYGWIPGYVSAAFYLPDRDTAYALQINSDVGMTGPDGAFQAILREMLQAVFADSAPAPAPAPPSAGN